MIVVVRDGCPRRNNVFLPRYPIKKTNAPGFLLLYPPQGMPKLRIRPTGPNEHASIPRRVMERLQVSLETSSPQSSFNRADCGARRHRGVLDEPLHPYR